MHKCNFIKIALGTIMCTALLAGTCFAAEREGEIKGLNVSVDSNKDEYEAGENIIVEVTVKNTTEEAVEDVVIKNTAPTGYQVVAGSEKNFTFDSIEAGDTKSVTTEYEVITAAPASDASDDSDDSDGDGHHKHHESKSTSAPTTTVEEELVPLSDSVGYVELPEEPVQEGEVLAGAAAKTGDDSNMILWMLLLAASASACSVLYFKRKEIRKYLAFALVVTVVGGSFSVCQMSAQAAGSNNSISLAKEVRVDGNAVTLDTQVFCGAYISGEVYSATNPDDKISGAQIKFRSGKDNKTGEYVTVNGTEVTLTSETDGSYICSLPMGEYTLECSKDGYITSYLNVTSDVVVNTFNVPMSTELAGDEFRIVLTWGDSPRDLDSHLEFDGHHVYYGYPTYSENGRRLAHLDVDDVDFFGPETITVKVQSGVDYHYYVKNFSASSISDTNDSLAKSGAKVVVYRGDAQIASFSVDSKSDAVGPYWNVFTIKNGQLDVVDAIGNTADVTENYYPVAATALDTLAVDDVVTDIDVTIDDQTVADDQTVTDVQDTTDDQTATDVTTDDQTVADVQDTTDDQTVADDQTATDVQDTTDDQTTTNDQVTDDQNSNDNSDSANTDADNADDDLADDANNDDVNADDSAANE